MTETEIQHWNKELDNRPAEEIIEKAFSFIKGKKVISISTQVEDIVLLDMILKQGLDIKAYTLDTGRLHEETLLMIDKIHFKYNIPVEVYFPDAEKIESLVTRKGMFSFKEAIENRKECCHLRKVEPNQRALKGASLWVTGLRREQSPDRKDTPVLEKSGELFKVNPLVNWSWDALEKYAVDNKLPMHPLYKKGFLSIGCAPCTRAVEPGEDMRAGRWWWENADLKECGLHVHG